MKCYWGFKILEMEVVKETKKTFTIRLNNKYVPIFKKQLNSWKSMQFDPMLRKEFLYGHRESLVSTTKDFSITGYPIELKKLNKQESEITFTKITF